MRKYGKWVLTLGLLAATPGLTPAAGTPSGTDDKPAADGQKPANAENQRVANEIAAALRSKKVSGDINIEFKGGVATLSGTVSDQKMKERASESIKKVRGITKVDNRLTTAPDKGRAVADKSRPAAPARLAANSALAAAAAPASGGVVSANHTAPAANPSRVQQVNAELPAGGVSGNQAIAEQIGAALTTARLDSYDIEIRYQNGVAMLSGNVRTQAEKATATQVVQEIPGVRSVANRLTCSQEPQSAMAALQGSGQMPGYGALPPQGQMPPRGPMPQGRPPQGYPSMPPQAQTPPGYPPMAPYGQMPPQGQMPPGYQMAAQGQMPPGYGPPQGQPPMPPQAGMYPAGFRQDGGMPAAAPQPGMNAMPMGPGVPMPPTYGNPGMGASQAVFNNPSVPDYAWPTYAQYPNSAAVSYPQQYSASAWPYIGPFYPYPQVPLGWRDATLRWDDGQWNLMFRTRTDKWWWYFNPNNW